MRTPPIRTTNNEKEFPAGSVSAGLIKQLLRFSHENGISPAEGAPSCLAGVSLSDPDIRLDFSIYQSMVEDILNKQQRPATGCDFGRFISQRGWTHPQFIIAMHCPNAHKMLRKIVEYDSLLYDGDPLQILDGRDTTTLRLGGLHFSDTVNRFTCDAIIAGIDNLLNLVLTNRVSPQFVRLPFEHGDPSPLHSICGDVRFNQSVAEIVYRTDDLRVPNALADADLLKSLEAHATSKMERLSVNCWSKRLFRTMSLGLVDGPNTLDGVARHFALSPRRLQQRLKQEGITFRDILDEVRVKKSYDLLRNSSHSLCDVALMIGFSEQSSFNHFFKKRTGITPREFRRKSLS